MGVTLATSLYYYIKYSGHGLQPGPMFKVRLVVCDAFSCWSRLLGMAHYTAPLGTENALFDSACMVCFNQAQQMSIGLL